MAEFWKEAYLSGPHGDRIADPLPVHARSLRPREFICVKVCSFTFRFVSIHEIQDYIAFFEQKTHPSSRLPIPPGVDGFYHWHSQRWYERLPMYLQEEPKKKKVLKALRQAVLLLESGKL